MVRSGKMSEEVQLITLAPDVIKRSSLTIKTFCSISSITSEAGLKTIGNVKVNSNDRNNLTTSLNTPPGRFSKIYPEKKIDKMKCTLNLIGYNNNCNTFSVFFFDFVYRTFSLAAKEKVAIECKGEVDPYYYQTGHV